MRASRDAARRLTILAVGSMLLLSIALSSNSWATHGAWTAHDLVWFEQGSSQYGSYADIGASNLYNYGHAAWERYYVNSSTLITRESVQCEGSCGYRKTVTRYFPQSAYDLMSAACAVAGAHKLPGRDQLYTPCSGWALQTHVHTARTH